MQKKLNQVANICIKCRQSLPIDAKFCMNCGTPVIKEVIDCPSCRLPNPPGTKSCYHCGTLLVRPDTISLDYTREYDLTGDTDIINSGLKGLFFKSLRTFIDDVFGNDRYSDYVELFYATDMQKKFDTKARVVTESVLKANTINSKEAFMRSDQLVSHLIRNMVMYHVIVHGKEINPCLLPESILWYQQSTKKNLPLKDMISDFLDLDRENLKIYTDFLTMPAEKLKNAAKSFLFAEKQELVFFICDQSLFGNAKDGFAMTNFGLYWKAELLKAQKIMYHDLKYIKKGNGHLLINGLFFNVNPSVNIKMHLLLQQLQDIFGK